MSPLEGSRPTLDDAAAQLVQVEPDDRDGLARVCDLLQRVADGADWPPAVEEMVGRAVWRLMDAIDGDADGLTEAGACVEQAMDLIESGPRHGHHAAAGPAALMVAPTSEAPDEGRGLFGDAGEAPGPSMPAVAPAEAAGPLQGGDVELVPPDADGELLVDFLTEASDYLAQAETALLELEADPAEPEAINTVFRAFHTVKGTSGFVRTGLITDIAHHAESVLGRMRNGEITCTGAYADLVLRAIDMLKALIAAIEGKQPGARGPLPAGYGELLGVLSRAGVRGAPEPAAAESAVPIAFPFPEPFAPDSVAPAEAPAALAARTATPPTPVAPARVAPVARTATPPALIAPAPAEALPAARAATPPGPAAPAGAVPAGRRAEPAADSSIRVRIERLDRLIDMVGELVIAQSMVAQDTRVSGPLGNGLVSQEDELARKVVHAGKIVRELQDLSLSLRMVPLRSTFQRLARAVRDVARQCGRVVELVAEGEETEIDRNMVDVIADPLLHMIRNAVDHGIEPPDERAQAGKTPAGTVWLRAYHGGGSVIVELRDDGRGLDRVRIAAKAIERGLIASDAGMSDQEVFGLIFAPGFSTAEKVSDISGRGVGMDVVRAAVETLRGRIELSSELGRGTTFTLRLPMTLAITDGMVVRVGDERYIVPIANIHLSFQPERAQLSSVSGRGELVRLRNDLLPLFRLARLYDIEGSVEDPTEALLVVVDDGDRRCALLVDDLLAQHQVVAKSLGSYIGSVDGVSGGAILGDGRVGLILDAFDLGGLARRSPLRYGAEPIIERSAMSDGTAKVTASVARTGGGKFLTFFLADEEYGLEILKVQEIIGLLPITRVPRTPAFIKGVINLRGKVIPVTDLRLKFGMVAIESTAETCIVVVRAAGVEVGLIVDRVSEVINIASEDVDPAPAFGPDVDTDYILGIAKPSGSVKLLLDIERVLSTQDVVDIRTTAGAAG